MNQREFNEQVIAILWKLAEHAGVGRFSEPKHGIVGDEIADMISDLENKHDMLELFEQASE
jgi:hypothetical protein